MENMNFAFREINKKQYLDWLREQQYESMQKSLINESFPDKYFTDETATDFVIAFKKKFEEISLDKSMTLITTINTTENQFKSYFNDIFPKTTYPFTHLELDRVFKEYHRYLNIALANFNGKRDKSYESNRNNFIKKFSSLVITLKAIFYRINEILTTNNLPNFYSRPSETRLKSLDTLFHVLDTAAHTLKEKYHLMVALKAERLIPSNDLNKTIDLLFSIKSITPSSLATDQLCVAYILLKEADRLKQQTTIRDKLFQLIEDEFNLFLRLLEDKIDPSIKNSTEKNSSLTETHFDDMKDLFAPTIADNEVVDQILLYSPVSPQLPNYKMIYQELSNRQFTGTLTLKTFYSALYTQLSPYYNNLFKLNKGEKQIKAEFYFLFAELNSILQDEKVRNLEIPKKFFEIKNRLETFKFVYSNSLEAVVLLLDNSFTKFSVTSLVSTPDSKIEESKPEWEVTPANSVAKITLFQPSPEGNALNPTSSQVSTYPQAQATRVSAFSIYKRKPPNAETEKPTGRPAKRYLTRSTGKDENHDPKHSSRLTWKYGH